MKTRLGLSIGRKWRETTRLLFRLQDWLALSAGETRALLTLGTFMFVGFTVQNIRVNSLGPPLLPPAAGDVALAAPSAQKVVEQLAEQLAEPLAVTVDAVPTTERPDAVRVDINSATALQLQALPGIGPAMATRIIEWRNGRGRFESVSDLQRVRGIGPKTVAKLSAMAFVGESGYNRSSSSKEVPLSDLNSLSVPAASDSTQSLLASSSRSRNR
ncbi:MAG: helix-hairpin-helix domain-containing protein [Bacteroidetes bacterium]|nr:helix-hairpin-helix domain-containing protein [Bacteroidota bacterium]